MQQYQDEEGADDWIVVEERRRRPQLDNMATTAPDNAREMEVGHSIVYLSPQLMTRIHEALVQKSHLVFISCLILIEIKIQV